MGKLRLEAKMTDTDILNWTIFQLGDPFFKTEMFEDKDLGRMTRVVSFRGVEAIRPTYRECVRAVVGEENLKRLE
jgi:hypothetical protein